MSQIFRDSSSDHFRIRDVVVRIDEAQPQRAERHLPPEPLAPPPQPSPLQGAYDQSVRKIDDNVYALAAATTALDLIESRLVEAKVQLERLRARGEPIDFGKVERTLVSLAEHINQAVDRADAQCVNLLRDTRMELRFTECSPQGDGPSMSVDLTLISLDKLMAHKLGGRTRDADLMIEVVDAMVRIVFQNVHILSSLILTLFAARDYTREMVGLVLKDQVQTENDVVQRMVDPAVVAEGARAQLARSDRALRGLEPPHGSARYDWPAPSQAGQPPGRLMALLDEVRASAGHH